MVSTIHNPFDKTKTNTVAAAFVASAILLSPGMMTMPYSQVYNTVVNQRQTNTSLDFSSIDRLKRDFFMTDAAENFLRYYDLTNVLTTAEKHIRDYFPEQHFTTFTLPRKLMKLVYTRPELSPLDFLRFGP